MRAKEGVLVSDLIRDLKLEVVYKPEDTDYLIKIDDINRPGLQFSGFFEYFAYDRVQIVGATEYTYFSYIENEKRKEILDKYMSYEVPLVIVSRGLEINEDVIEYAKKYNRILVSTKYATTKIIHKVSTYLTEAMAPKTSMHGVLVDIFGVGVLIRGESGVGKSEAALELVQRGHRLVADDSVELSRLDTDEILGQAPELLGHHLEIRGIGIINIATLYGVGAVKHTKTVELIVDLEHWNKEVSYDRLGLETESKNILGIDIESKVIPVKPGRNTAMVIEVAAMKAREKSMGYDAAKEFTARLNAMINENR